MPDSLLHSTYFLDFLDFFFFFSPSSPKASLYTSAAVVESAAFRFFLLLLTLTTGALPSRSAPFTLSSVSFHALSLLSIWYLRSARQYQIL